MGCARQYHMKMPLNYTKQVLGCMDEADQVGLERFEAAALEG